MLSTICDTHQTDSHRNALYLAEQCLRKYGGMRSEIAQRIGLTAAERDKLKSQGAMAVIHPSAPAKHFAKVANGQAYGTAAIQARRYLDLPRKNRPRVSDFAQQVGVETNSLFSQITLEVRIRANPDKLRKRTRAERIAAKWLDANPEDAQGLLGYEEDRKRQFARRKFAESHGITNSAFAHAINRVRLMRQIDKP